MGESSKTSGRSDPELDKMKKQILELLPEMADQIANMEKSDLQEVLEMIGGQGEPASKSTDNKRDKMIKVIISTFPDMKQEVEALDDKDIEEIYNQINQQNEGEQSHAGSAAER